MTYLDLDRFHATPLKTDPYDYIVVENFLKQDKFKDVIEDFPKVPGPGSHPPSALKISGDFRGLLDELQGEDFRKAVETKFNIDLTGRPTMYTVRGFVRKKDGSIHTDSKTKIITVLVYMNDNWDDDGGRLRILRNGTDLENYTDEVSPVNGTLLVFRRSDNSWHGHHPHEGQRRAIQMNWVLNDDVVRTEQGRHFVSTYLKWLKNLFQQG